jgi:hypothetical protein
MQTSSPLWSLIETNQSPSQQATTCTLETQLCLLLLLPYYLPTTHLSRDYVAMPQCRTSMRSMLPLANTISHGPLISDQSPARTIFVSFHPLQYTAFGVFI